MAKVLVAEDEAKLSKVLAEMLELDGHEVTRARGGREALVELASRTFDIVLTDLRMPEVDGLAVLKDARGKQPPPEVIMMTAYGTTQDAVEAMKGGAADYLTKPFSMDELRLRVRRLAEKLQTDAKNSRLMERLMPVLVAESQAMKAALASARQVAPTEATVLLLGESGTGKSQLARAIHYQSKRAGGPLVEVHCAALTDSLLESELFGHEKGAFTGATERKPGHLVAADGGTLFLDEIGEVAASTQVKLLRFLQDRECIPVGSTQPRKLDVRIIAATNRDLAEAVKSGVFREDFYYRLNVFSIRVPPLRERREDILALAEQHLSHRGLPPSKVGASGRETLLRHIWPGNVRELENALERALILADDGPIEAEHFSAGAQTTRTGNRIAAEVLSEGFNLDAFERELIYAALQRAAGNKAAAARILGITRRRLYSRLAALSDLKDERADDP